MDSYILTEKFTLIPKHLYRPEYHEQMFSTDKDETVKCLEVEKHNAILAYAAPVGQHNAEAAEVSDNNGSSAKSCHRKVHIIYKLIELSDALHDHNKIVIHYSIHKKRTYIVAMEGEKLLLANTYRTTNIMDLLYFLTLVTQQVMFNPLHTRINSFGEMEQDDIKVIEEYFCKVAIINNNQ